MNYETTSVGNLNLSKTVLRETLISADAEIVFMKKDGTKRNMKCTLREDAIVNFEKKTDRVIKPNDNTLAVWDLEAEGWRTVNVDTIESLKVY